MVDPQVVSDAMCKLATLCKTLYGPGTDTLFTRPLTTLIRFTMAQDGNC
jgi:hypothetical protein